MRMIKIATCLGALLITSPCLFADEVNTGDGGIEVYRSDDDKYWFKLHGVTKVDAVFFDGDFDDKGIDFPNGTNIRALDTNLTGGIGKDLSFSVVLTFAGRSVGIDDAYFTYSGLKNTEISVGQISSPFCLENANSSKWIPFLERSLPVIALRPCMGIGVNISNWGEHYGVIFASSTPPHGENTFSTNVHHRSDRLTNTLRAFFVPINEDNKVIQIGGSGLYATTNATFLDDTPNVSGRRFASRPEAIGRNTPNTVDSGNQLLADNYNEITFELSGQRGPLVVGAEYLQANIHRLFDPELHFRGWHAQAAYVLTGESRIYSIKNGTYGRIKPKCRYGAFEVAARYSMVNLNSEDIHGGKEDNVALSLSWIINPNLLILTNYIHASIDPTQAPGARYDFNPNHRNLNIFGVRTQVVW